MKERPILFSAPMVRALLAGTKTQTRRVVRPLTADRINHCPGHLEELRHVSGPYGQPGDRLWVREAWRVIDVADCFAPRELTAAHRIWFDADGPHEPPAGRYRPGMFMPRWASRITLEVTDVRVERLQDISIEEAKAEGAWPDVSVVADCEAYFGIDTLAVNPYRAFQMLWERINGPESWAANPWVWAITFKRVEK